MSWKTTPIRPGLLLLCLAVCLEIPAVSSAQPPRRPSRRDDPDGGQDFFRLKRAPAGEEAIPVDRYFEALRRMKTMRGHSLRLHQLLPSREEMAGKLGAAGAI